MGVGLIVNRPTGPVGMTPKAVKTTSDAWNASCPIIYSLFDRTLLFYKGVYHHISQYQYLNTALLPMGPELSGIGFVI